MAAVANQETLRKVKTAHSKYRPEIDGLRAFAVIAVIVNHFDKDFLPSGYLGVDIFFVISGYVITSSLAEKKSMNFFDFVSGFYERRIKRLLPALVVFVFITSVLISFFNPEPNVLLGLGWRSLFGISNINLYQSSTDYFAESTDLNPFTHTWSLGVEEQFYLIFPLLIWFSGFGQQKTNGSRNLFFCVALISVVSFISFIYLYKLDQPAAYFLMPPRFWEMATGCLVYIGLQKRTKIEQILAQFPPLLILIVIFGIFLLPIELAVPATFSIVVLTAVLIACLREGTIAYKLCTFDKIVYLGLISYSLYLWHWSVLSISRWTIGINFWLIPIQLVIIFLLAIGSFKYVETPLRRARWSPRSWFNIGIGMTPPVIISLLIAGYIRTEKASLFLGEKQYSGFNQIGSLNVKFCSIYDDKILKYGDKEFFKYCGSADFIGRPTIYSLGDSHAAQFNRFWAEYARTNKYNYVFIQGPGCLFPAAIVSGKEIKCYDRQKIVEQKILPTVGMNDILFIGNALYAKFNEEWSDRPKFYSRIGVEMDIDNAAKMFSSRFQDIASNISTNGGKTILYVDSVQFPRLRNGSVMCKIEWFRPKWSLDKGCYNDLGDHFRIIERHFAWRKIWGENPSNIVWNAYMYANSCSNNQCNASRYKDNNHFSRDYAAHHFNAFIRNHPELIDVDKHD